jgi:dipeptidyl aminopeptidase/acylaminoacyl peptidase
LSLHRSAPFLASPYPLTTGRADCVPTDPADLCSRVVSGPANDGSPAFSPDGNLVFESNRPKIPLTSRPTEGEPIPGSVSNLWRVDRVGTGWTKPARLPDTVNLAGQSIWKPSIAADGTIYFVSIDKKGGKRLYSSQYKDGAYQQAQPPSFSDGTTLDVDPEIAPD